MKWYEVSNVEEIASPALLVYPQRVRENIGRMLAMVGGEAARLRPHVKTHKLPQVVRMQQEAGIGRFKCATIAEAEMVAQCAAPDVLLAYQPVGPNIRRLARLAQQYPDTRFSAVVDDAATAEAISQAAQAAGVELSLLLEIDNGMHRTGIAPGEAAAALYRRLADLPGILAGGFHVYDGQHRQADLAARIEAVEAAMAPVLRLRDQLLADGLPVPQMVCGGTPTFPAHARHADRQCSPGTCLFWDASYAGKFPDLQFLHAAVLLTRVISRPDEEVLCLDLGYKAVSPDNPDPRVQLFGLDDATTLVHNEEHLALRSPQADRYRVGDVLYGIPWHVCPTCALHREAVVVEDHRAGERWEIVARDRRLTV